MSNKKAIICTALLYIIASAVYMITLGCKFDVERKVSLFNIVSPVICVWFMCDKTMQFYHWLRKE